MGNNSKTNIKDSGNSWIVINGQKKARSELWIDHDYLATGTKLSGLDERGGLRLCWPSDR